MHSIVAPHSLSKSNMHFFGCQLLGACFRAVRPSVSYNNAKRSIPVREKQHNCYDHIVFWRNITLRVFFPSSFRSYNDKYRGLVTIDFIRRSLVNYSQVVKERKYNQVLQTGLCPNCSSIALNYTSFFLLAAAWVDPGRSALQSAEQRCKGRYGRIHQVGKMSF